MEKRVVFSIKANVSKIAKEEQSTEDNIIDTLTNHFTDESARFGTECWLDDVYEEGACTCNAHMDEDGLCVNCNNKI